MRGFPPRSPDHARQTTLARPHKLSTQAPSKPRFTADPADREFPAITWPIEHAVNRNFSSGTISPTRRKTSPSPKPKGQQSGNQPCQEQARTTAIFDQSVLNAEHTESNQVSGDLQIDLRKRKLGILFVAEREYWRLDAERTRSASRVVHFVAVIGETPAT